jgi:hypothetical protein
MTSGQSFVCLHRTGRQGTGGQTDGTDGTGWTNNETKRTVQYMSHLLATAGKGTEAGEQNRADAACCVSVHPIWAGWQSLAYMHDL